MSRPRIIREAVAIGDPRKVDSNGNIVCAQLDSSSGLLTIISDIHSKIHDGKFFTSSVLADDVADGSSLDLVLTANASYNVHARITYTAEKKSHFRLYEAPTTSGGSAVSIFDKNRDSANSSNATLVSGPTVSNVGNLRFTHLVPAGTGRHSSGGAGTSGYEEWVLKANTKYLMRLTHDSGSGTSDLNFIFEFYETPA